jgi:hypothetical protein
MRVARVGQDRPRRPFDHAFFVGSQLLWKIDALQALSKPNDMN